MASSRTASISSRSRSSPPARRNAAKYWAGKRTSGSKRPANRSCPAENPRFPFATIPLPLVGRRAAPPGLAGSPHAYHGLELQKNPPPDENAWPGRLGSLIALQRRRQGFFREELHRRRRGARGDPRIV